jgi:ribosomal protein L35
MEDIENPKYYCEKCNYRSNILSGWTKHINTVLHITGKKKIRSDCKEINTCSHCDFKIKNNQQFKEHILNYHSTKEEREKGFKYYCTLCDYGTFAQSFIEKHNNTTKHERHLKNKI